MEECISHNELLFVNNRFCFNIEDFINSIFTIAFISKECRYNTF
jgi:hypothetical protein